MSRPSMLRFVAAACALGAALLAPPASARDCKGTVNFTCRTVTVPLDRAGRVTGEVKLAVAVERPRKGATGFLLALSGGPGQPAIAYADSFRSSLAPALAHRRLVLVDQRGTGESGALQCPPLQALGTLDVVNTRIVASCAARLGPRRQFYATTDSVLDLDAVRASIGADKWQLMGVSYGTYVAVQYARRFPQHTDGLILDSVVGPDGIDAYFLDTFERLPRILKEQCADRRCAGVTRDPVGDLGTLTGRLHGAALRGTIPGADGRPQRTAIHDESELLLMIMSGDLNPFLQAAFPGAIKSAINGDRAPLLRLRRLAQGPSTPYTEFSSTLNVATTCADVKLPYTLSTPFGTRWELWRHGVDGLPAADYAPWSKDAVVDTSVAHDCLRWPEGDAPAGPSTDPLPDVPALLLSGRLDTRTPLENSREMLPSLPHGQLLTVGGTGHDILDSDITGCAAKALRRWAAGQSIGTPCRGKSNAVSILARPPRSLSVYRHPPGVPGVRGRIVYAVLDTLVDAKLSALQTLYAGFDPVRGGGLRGGRFAADENLGVSLHRYSYVPGVRVSGSDARLRIDGPGHLDGVLHLGRHGVITGRLGGRAIRTRRGVSSTARANAGRFPTAPRLPSLRVAAARAARLRALGAS
jgi:pimeloyl-ACP methyl ester carboxylesterase